MKGIKMSKEIELKNLPYTIVGGTATPTPMLSILLTAEGIKELAKRTKKGDMVRIREWSDVTEQCAKKKYYSEITIIKKEK